MKKILLSILTLLPFFLAAQQDSSESDDFFIRADFGRYFPCEIHAPISNIELGPMSNSPEYDLDLSGSEYKVYQMVHLGVEVPIYKHNFGLKNGNEAGFSFSLPMGFHLIWDPFQDLTAPIINMDYRFSLGTLRYYQTLKSKWIQNFVFQYNPISHESTHIGDELMIFRELYNFPLTRVNVSYEYTEFALTLNDPAGRTGNIHSLKLGMMMRINGDDGWYTVSSYEGDSLLAISSDIKSEFYAQYNWQSTRGLLANDKWHRVLSFEARERVKFGYPWYSLEVRDDGTKYGVEHVSPEKRVFNGNLFFGWRRYTSKNHSFGIFMHAYYGINPYGQFRSMDNFKYLGLSFIVD